MIARISDEITDPKVSARIPNAIQAAIRFYESERFWFNEGESTTSTVDGQQAYAMPTDFLEGEALTVTLSGIRFPMKRRPWSWLRRHNLLSTTTTLPRNWAYFADQMFLYPVPDKVYTLTLSYLKRLAALAAYADTNDWMVHGEELIRTRVQWDLMFHTVKDYKAAAMLAVAVDDALSNLRGKSEQKIATGRLSFDAALVGRGAYNINYE
jgi:hypothetical protein